MLIETFPKRRKGGIVPMHFFDNTLQNFERHKFFRRFLAETAIRLPLKRCFLYEKFYINFAFIPGYETKNMACLELEIYRAVLR